MPADLSAASARNLALCAQGFDQPRPATADAAALLAMIRRLGVLQLDSVNVLMRSHYLPAWSRLGAYQPEALDALGNQAPRLLFEYWGHEASLLPVDLQPWFRWRMANAAADAWRHVREMRTRRRLLTAVLDFLRERGPIGVADLEVVVSRKRSGSWWGWSDGKRALEWLFWSGQITAAGRRRFERLYDLPERVLPPEVLAAPTPRAAEAHRGLVEQAARALGVATEADLRDYYRLPLAAARGAVAELAEGGVLRKVSVEGWTKPGYLHRDVPAAWHRHEPAPWRAALLSPFDSLIWARERTERIFGMRVRLEVYTPAPKRVHGYYVLPLLLGDQLVARVDLKADRGAGALLVQAAHVEPKAPRLEVAAALAEELRQLARWQGLEQVRVSKKGALAASLATEIRAVRAIAPAGPGRGQRRRGSRARPEPAPRG